jgi:hypothetical protein
VIKVTRGRTQRVVRHKGVIVSVRCNEACGFMASARLRVSGSEKRYPLRKASRLLGSGQRARVRLRLYPNGLRALRRKRRGYVIVTIAARDAARNRATRRVGIRARP